MFVVFIRTAFLYALVVFVMRLMGKRQIGELQPYEFVITIMISDLAALPMQDTKLPLILGVIPIITLLFLKNLLSQLQLKSQYARKFIDGEPSILIYKSKINYTALKSQQINLDELMEEIRLAGYFDLSDVQYAILENNGQLSILPSNLAPENSTPAQSINSPNSKKQEPLIPKILVVDGKINNNSLTTLNQDKTWIEDVLKKHGLNSIKEVLLAMYDTQGKFVYQLYDEYEKECKK